MARPAEAWRTRKLAQPFVEQKIRPLAAEAVVERRRIRRMDPARAEVAWVIDRESIGSLMVLGRRTDIGSGADPLGRSVRKMRETRAMRF
jgi:hypothetical protein